MNLIYFINTKENAMRKFELSEITALYKLNKVLIRGQSPLEHQTHGSRHQWEW